jgi:hypothetical protein
MRSMGLVVDSTMMKHSRLRLVELRVKLRSVQEGDVQHQKLFYFCSNILSYSRCFNSP